MNITARFVLVGVIGAIVELTLLTGLVRINGKVMLSNFIAFHCAFAIFFFCLITTPIKNRMLENTKVPEDFWLSPDETWQPV